jgi:hypothetical protein
MSIADVRYVSRKSNEFGSPDEPGPLRSLHEPVDLRDGPEYCRDCDGTNSVPCTEDGTELLDGDFDDADYRRCTDCGAVR